MLEQGLTSFRTTVSHYSPIESVIQAREFATLMIINPANKVNSERGTLKFSGDYVGNIFEDLTSLGIVTLYENWKMFNLQLQGKIYKNYFFNPL